MQKWRVESTENQAKITENQILLEQKVVAEAVSVEAQLSELQNLTKQLLTDLQVLKGRQVVSGGIQGFQLFILITYLITICTLCVVKHCKKRQEKVAKAEFALLEKQLTESRRKRRAAAAAMNKQTPQ